MLHSVVYRPAAVIKQQRWRPDKQMGKLSFSNKTDRTKGRGESEVGVYYRARVIIRKGLVSNSGNLLFVLVYFLFFQQTV